jgi:beta-lactam-binding protein with PASTA domain
VSVPDLNRLTESAARQVLQSLGLRLDIATGLREEGYASGQAMRQQPRATLKAPRGSQVMVVFAQ